MQAFTVKHADNVQKFDRNIEVGARNMRDAVVKAAKDDGVVPYAVTRVPGGWMAQVSGGAFYLCASA